MSAGDAEVGVMIQPVDGASSPDVITPMLAAIADAAVKQSGSVASPGRIRLPILGVEIPIRNGVWGIRTVTDVWGRIDVLSRQARSGAPELHISPFVLPLPGRCEQLGTTSPFGTTSVTFASGRRYGGDKWRDGAWEQQPPPFKALQAFVCRNAGTNAILFARIDYEKTAITDADRNVIRQILDDVGDAVDSKLATTASDSAPTAANAFVLEPQVLSDPQGFDFSGYLRVAISRIRNNWFAAMPEAARNGGKGRVDISFSIARDGSVQDQRLLVSSRNNDLDIGALSAIQLSTPLARLPPEFKGERLVLRFTFSYNLTPDSPR
jgi:TonB family protein